ncbi:4Fe-4S binding protein [candidate division KSB1 bacterium]|nr:4Fe-4S binding protein [candidate division KSB1 bacterium]
MDAFPVVVMFVFFIVSALLLIVAVKKTTGRRIVQSVSLFIFVFLIHRCLCVIRGWAYGIIEIGRDDLVAFENLCMFVLIIGFTLLFGRIFCGWICPLGFLQELSGHLNRKQDRNMGALILYVLLLIIAVGYLVFFRPATDFFTENLAAIWSVILVLFLILFRLRPIRRTKNLKYYSLTAWVMLGLLSVYLTNPWCVLYGDELDYSSLLALFVVVSAASVHSMAWCRYLCPLGALLALVGRTGMIKLHSNGCKGCINRQCEQVCSSGALKNGEIEMAECVLCGECIAKCNMDIKICS